MKGREYVYLPSFEMCRVTSEPCRILYDTDFFPPNLKCDRKIWSCDNCRNDVREVKFNAMGQCMSPLIPTESSINHYPGKLGLTYFKLSTINYRIRYLFEILALT